MFASSALGRSERLCRLLMYISSGGVMTYPVRLPPNCEYCGIAMRYEAENFVCANGHPPHRVFPDGREYCACPKCDERRNAKVTGTRDPG